MFAQELGELQYRVLYGCTIAFMVTSTVAVSMRMFVRSAILKKIGYDDWALVLALAFFIINCGVSIRLYESRQQLYDVLELRSSPDILNHYILLERMANGFYALAILASKVSLSVFFLDLFGPAYRYRRIYIWVALAVCTIINFIFFILDISSCGIIGNQNSQTSCHFANAGHDISVAMSVINASVDLSYTVLAITLLATTTLNRWAKVTAAVLLSFGTLGGIASVLRVVVQLAYVPAPIYGILVGRWSTIEAGICITTAGLATTRPLFRAIRDAVVSVNRSRRQSEDIFTQYASNVSGRSHSRVESGNVFGGRRASHIMRSVGGDSVKNIVVFKEVHVDSSCRSDSIAISTLSRGTARSGGLLVPGGLASPLATPMATPMEEVEDPMLVLPEIKDEDFKS
ncbi:hypothetical protein MBLNU457_6469t1 [Dothideomycetes sp. NU457]